MTEVEKSLSPVFQIKQADGEKKKKKRTEGKRLRTAVPFISITQAHH